MFIAAINEQILYLIAAAAYGVFAWWNNRKNKDANPDQEEGGFPRPDAPPPRQDAPRQPQQPAESEQERLRRFLEALGVPAGQQQPPQQPRPVPQQPPPQQQPRTIAPPISRPTPPPRTPAEQPRPFVRPVVHTQRPVARPRPMPVMREVNEMESVESRDPGRLDESALAIERIGTDIDQMSRDFVTTSAGSQAPAASPGAANALFTATQARTILEIFRTPETLRTALLAQEILGPPRGLQS